MTYRIMRTHIKYCFVLSFLFSGIICYGQEAEHSTFKVKKESGCDVVIAGRVIHNGDTISEKVFQNTFKIMLAGCGSLQHILSYDWHFVEDGQIHSMTIESNTIISKIHNWANKQTDTADFVITNIVCFTNEGNRFISKPLVLRILPEAKMQ